MTHFPVSQHEYPLLPVLDIKLHAFLEGRQNISAAQICFEQPNGLLNLLHIFIVVVPYVLLEG
jgi:hypothetical protein